MVYQQAVLTLALSSRSSVPEPAGALGSVLLQAASHGAMSKEGSEQHWPSVTLSATGVRRALLVSLASSRPGSQLPAVPA